MAANLPTNYSDEAAQASPVGSFVITPDDDNDITVAGGAVTATNLFVMPKGLFLDVAATVKITWANGMVDTLELPAGGHKMRVRRVWATPDPGSTNVHGLV
jgi:hypothetical protein